MTVSQRERLLQCLTSVIVRFFNRLPVKKKKKKKIEILLQTRKEAGA